MPHQSFKAKPIAACAVACLVLIAIDTAFSVIAPALFMPGRLFLDDAQDVPLSSIATFYLLYLVAICLIVLMMLTRKGWRGALLLGAALGVSVYTWLNLARAEAGDVWVFRLVLVDILRGGFTSGAAAALGVLAGTQR